jgi:hypothetical protein
MGKLKSTPARIAKSENNSTQATSTAATNKNGFLSANRRTVFIFPIDFTQLELDILAPNVKVVAIAGWQNFNSSFRVMAMYLHIFQAHPQLPRLPTRGFEAEDNVLSRMI